jgi:hypothetical protein
VRHAHGLILALVTGLALGAAPAAAQPSCGDVLTQDTTLTADLGCDDTALVIGAAGITLDLGGHSVYSTDGHTIVNDGHDDVTIRNGEVHGEGGLILLSGVSGNLVRDLYAEGLIRGIDVEDSDHNRFVHNHVNSVSFVLTGSDHNVIAHNKVTRYEGYLGLGDSNYNRVVDNIVWVGRSGAFGLGSGSHHNQVRRNVFLGDSYAVIGVLDAHDNELVENTIGSTPPSGIAGDVLGSNRNRFVRNTIFGVTQGLRVGGDGNVFRANDVSGVAMSTAHPYPPWLGPVFPDGMPVISTATNATLRDNVVRGFDDDGIDVDAPGTRLGGNNATDNGDLGIEAVPGVIDLGGNSASGNGNPAQCTNVFCS